MSVIDRLTGDAMIRLLPRMPRTDAEAWAGPLARAADEYHIDTEGRLSMWLANLCHESKGFTRFVENMNYSAKRLAEVWKHRYAENPRAIDLQPNERARQIGGNPQMIANDVYANRLGNGPPATGDGWRFRGRYPVQLTGKENYSLAEVSTGLDLLTDPDVHLRDLDAMARISGWFWWYRGLEVHADAGDFGSVVKLWNGGTIGLDDRIAWHKRALDALGIA